MQTDDKPAYVAAGAAAQQALAPEFAAQEAAANLNIWLPEMVAPDSQGGLRISGLPMEGHHQRLSRIPSLRQNPETGAWFFHDSSLGMFAVHITFA